MTASSLNQPPSTPLLPCRVYARVRREGAVGDYYRREFTLMLGADTPERMAQEARRILRQSGYETRGLPQLSSTTDF